MILLIIIGVIFFLHIQETNKMAEDVHPIDGSWKTVVEKGTFRKNGFGHGVQRAEAA